MVKPLTVQLVVALEHDRPPGEAVAVYDVMAEPPLVGGAVQETGTWVFW